MANSTTKALTLPVINMNGDSGATLLRQHRDMLDALNVAANTLSSAMPHGRNYASPELLKSAREEYIDIINSIDAINKRMHVVALHISDSF